MFDLVVVGGGIVGLCAAYEYVRRHPGTKICILEKEHDVALHQSGRNSGVLHSGLYYAPGSLKARLCQAGITKMVDFCNTHRVRHEICGKLVVATQPKELPGLNQLKQRGLENGLAVERLDRSQLHEREPNVNGIAALWVPEAGIADFAAVCQTLKALLQEQNVEIRLRTQPVKVCVETGHTTIETNSGQLQTRFALNCAGLQSDRVAQLWGEKSTIKIVPFRGEYFSVDENKAGVVKHLIYPVPNPKFPFLGVHITRQIDGGLHIGPNAVLSLQREGYRKTDVNLKDAWESLTYPGFWRLALNNLGDGCRELWRSWSKAAFTKNVQRLVPSIQSSDLIPSPAGVRAMALAPNGALVDDFVLSKSSNVLHVLNAPSPAATSAFAIAQCIVDQIP